MKTIAGVALAALMTCGLGGLQRAEASPFSFSLTGDTFQGATDLGPVSFSYTIQDPKYDGSLNLDGHLQFSSSFGNDDTTSASEISLFRDFNLGTTNLTIAVFSNSLHYEGFFGFMSTTTSQTDKSLIFPRYT